MRFETGTVDITLGDKKFDTNYEKKVYESIEDILKEVSEDEKKNSVSILKKLNMAEDWERRTSARNEYLKDGDAAKAASFEAQVKAFMKAREKAGKPVTESQARAKVTLMMED